MSGLPNINDGKKNGPVMFWLLWGFTAGSSQELPSYDGEKFSKRRCCGEFSINHRLNFGLFRILSAYGEKYKQSANLSIWTLAALEWLKANIESFGMNLK
jgi:para-nitrobenzyl esterase